MQLNKKYGLGKGLGALIPEDEISEIDSILKININLIKSNEYQPRKHFDDERIAELAQSIKEHGIIQPIVLTKDGENYTIVAGERRWRAAKMVGIREIPAVVMELTNKQILEISLIENLQREDLNPIEEAIAFKRLLDDFELTQEALGLKLGKSRTSITNVMRLLQLDSRVKGYLIEGVISEGHGRALLGISDSTLQYEMAQKIIDEGLNVRQVEGLIRDLSKEKLSKSKSAARDITPYLNDIKYRLENYFGTKVLVSNSKNNKGKIEIEYYSQEDLDRIIEILNM